MLSFSSKKEIGVKIYTTKQSKQEGKDFVFENIASLENVCLAGGGPRLMKENDEFWKFLHEKNPNCYLKVNTRISTTCR